MRDIIIQVAKVHGLTEWDLRGNSHLPHLTHARHVAMWQIRHDLHLSYPVIGREFNRDHTTVMNAVRKIDQLTERGRR